MLIALDQLIGIAVEGDRRLARKVAPEIVRLYQTPGQFRDKLRELLSKSMNVAALKGPVENWVTGSIATGWRYALRLQTNDDRWRVVELRVFPDATELADKDFEHWISEPLDFVASLPAAQSLTARDLRKIPFTRAAKQSGDYLDTLRMQMDLVKAILPMLPNIKVPIPHDLIGSTDVIEIPGVLRSYLAKLHRRVRPAPSTTGLARLAAIAAAYIEQIRGGSTQPVADAARDLKMKSSQVRDALHDARQRRLLTGTRGRGYSGGMLTPVALALLDAYRKERLAMQGRRSRKAPRPRPKRSRPPRK